MSGALAEAAVVLFPILCACVGLMSGVRGRHSRLVPAAAALLMSVAAFAFGTIIHALIYTAVYAAIGYAFFAVSRLMGRFLRARGRSGPYLDLTAMLSFCMLTAILLCYFISKRWYMLPIALLFWAACTAALMFRYKLRRLPVRALDILSKPLGVFILTAAYILTASLLLCPLDALDTLEKYESPLFFTVPLGLIFYPLIFLLTGIAAGRFPKKLWPVPLAVLAILFTVSNCYGRGLFAIGFYSDMDYYMRHIVFTMLVYVGLGYLAMLLSRVFFRNRPEPLIPRFWVALGTLAAGPLIFGAAYIPGFCWGHPLWGELLWYILHLGLAVTVGILSGGNIRRYVLMPFLPLLVTYMQICPPVVPSTQPKLPWALGEAWAVVCFFVCYLCMLLKFFLKPKN